MANQQFGLYTRSAMIALPGSSACNHSAEDEKNDRQPKIERLFPFFFS